MPLVRPARTADFDTVMGLLDERVRWLRARGSDQWITADRWPPSVRASIEEGRVFLLEDDDGSPVGTITVSTAGDQDFWTAAELSEPALYLAKLATARRVAGRDLGGLLLRWCEVHAARLGCAELRLDVWRTAPGLHRWYEQHGWQHVRTVEAPGRYSGALFRHPITLTEPPPGLSEADSHRR